MGRTDVTVVVYSLRDPLEGSFVWLDAELELEPLGDDIGHVEVVIGLLFNQELVSC